MKELKYGKSKFLHFVLIFLIIALVILLCYSNLDVLLSHILTFGDGVSYSKSADDRAFVCIALMLVIDILLIANKDHKLSKGWCVAWLISMAFLIISVLVLPVGDLVFKMYCNTHNVILGIISGCLESTGLILFGTPYSTFLPVFDVADHSIIVINPTPTPWIETAAAKCLLTVLVLSVFNFTSGWIFLPHPKLKKLLKKDKTSINEEKT